MAISHFWMLICELLNKGPDIVPEEYLLITSYSKYDVCMAKNGNYTKHTRQIYRRVNFVRNGEKFKRHKIDWCEGVFQLADIGIKIFSENDLNPRMKYFMVRLEH